MDDPAHGAPAPDRVGGDHRDARGASRERSHLVRRAQVFDADDLRRAVTRIGHEIVERNRGPGDVVVVGLYTRGVALARRIAAAIASFEGVEVPAGALDVSFHRDDFRMRAVAPQGPTDIPVDVSGRAVVLVDDVLYTGRTARAAMEGVMELGRPRAIQLAVLVDRGHRELPVRADYVGKNLPTRRAEDVRVRLEEVDDEPDGVQIWGPPDEDDERAGAGDAGADEDAGSARADEDGSEER